jgi:hypothetical protein
MWHQYRGVGGLGGGGGIRNGGGGVRRRNRKSENGQWHQACAAENKHAGKSWPRRRNRIIAGVAGAAAKRCRRSIRNIKAAAAGSLWRRWRRGISNKQRCFLKRICNKMACAAHQNAENGGIDGEISSAKKMAYHQTGIGERGVSGGGGESSMAARQLQ